MPDEPKKPPITQPSESTEIPGLPERNSNAGRPEPWESLASTLGITPDELRKAKQPLPLPPPHIFGPQPRQSPGPGEPGYGPDLRRDIASAVDKNEATMAKSTPLSPSVQGMVDKGVLGICELLGLLFALPFGEDLYHDMPITGWHWFYLAVGVLCAGAGPMFPWIRTRSWIPERFSASLSLAALDVRIWIAVLLILFVYAAAPDLYRRAMRPVAIVPPPQTGGQAPPRPAAAAEDIAKATAPIRAERDKAIKDRDALAKQLDNTKEALALAQRSATAPAAGSVKTEAGEVGALRLLYSGSGFEILAKSANIRAAEVQKTTFDSAIPATVICTVNCVTIRMVFDGSYGPFDVLIREGTPQLLFTPSSSPKVSIARAGEGYLDVVIEPGYSNYLGGAGLRELRLSITKRTY
jgi:hypothetical protein